MAGVAMREMKRKERMVRKKKVERFALTILVLAGCGPTEPPPQHHQDLGTEESPLLPPSRTWHDASIEKGGQAEWHPFPQVTEESLAARKSKKANSKQPVEGEAAETEASDAELEVRRMIEAFNKVAAEKNWEDLSKFFIESQQTTMIEATKAQLSLVEKFTALAAVLEEKAPNEAGAVRKLVDAAAAQQDMTIRVGPLAAEGEGVFGGKMEPPAGIPVPEGLLFIKFRRVDDQWKVDSAAMTAAAATLPMIAPLLGQLDGMVESVRSGALPADALAKQLGALTTMFPTAPTGDTEKGADEKKTDEPDGE